VTLNSGISVQLTRDCGGARSASVRLSTLWLDPDSIIHGGPDALLAAEVSLRGLDREVVAQPRASSSQIMRCQPVDGSLCGELTDDMPDDFFGHPFTPDPPGSIHPPE
jgi:hypothetical protein